MGDDQREETGPGVPILIHVGLPKAASTTLQHQFAGDARLAYFGPGAPTRAGSARALVDPLIFGDEATFTGEAPAAARDIRAQGADRRAIVLSDEVLTLGNHAKRAAQWPRVAPIPPTRTAARLARMFPQAKILLIFRAQFDWISSHFLQMQYVNAMSRDLASFLDEGMQGDHPYALDPVLDYDALFAAYAAAFGEAQVKPRLFEDIGADSGRFLAEVYRWLGLEPPVGAGDVPNLNTRSRVHPALRHAAARALPLNRIKARAPGLFQAVKGIMPGQAREVALTPAQRRMIDDRFGPSNQRLAARVGRSLPPRYPGATP